MMLPLGRGLFLGVACNPRLYLVILFFNFYSSSSFSEQFLSASLLEDEKAQLNQTWHKNRSPLGDVLSAFIFSEMSAILEWRPF